MTNIHFGLKPPGDHRGWWGARAIYRDRSIDLLHDRQQFVGDPNTCAALQAWLNETALPKLRALAAEFTLPSPEENGLVVISGGGFRLHASPRSSYGYLYIGAWDDPEAEPGLSVRVLPDLHS